MNNLNFHNYSIKDVNMHSKIIFELKWNCDGSYIGSVSNDRSVKIGQMDVSNCMAKTIHTIPNSQLTTQIAW